MPATSLFAQIAHAAGTYPPPIISPAQMGLSPGSSTLPQGKVIVFRQINAPGGASTGESIDFWLEDLDGKTKTHLAHLSGRYATLSFDITPDGKRIVLDRVNDNSDIVLIDIPR